MNGPQHYAEAEAHLQAAEQCGAAAPAAEAAHLHYAQAHTALADLAFRVDLHLRGDVEAWKRVTE